MHDQRPAAPGAAGMAAYRPGKAEVSTLILFVSYSGALGGAERVLLDVAGSLPDEVCVACPPGPLAGACERAGLRVLALAPRRLRLRGGALARARAVASLTGHGRELARLLRDLRPDATVLWGMRSSLAWLLVRSALDGAGGRVVVAHHDMLPAGPGIAAGVRAAAARADAVVVNSRAVADDLDPRGGLGSRLSLVYPGVDVPPEAPPWPTGPPLVTVIGALVGWKRVELALEAVAIARRSVPSLRLRVVGAALHPGDGVEQRLRARAAEPDLAGCVEFTGAVDDAAGEATDAICLLHCAEREPFGLVVAEALACGRPVVVPACGGPAEIVDASCAITYPSGDAGAAATGLVALASDPERARAMGAAGRARVAKRFGRAAMREGFARAIAPNGSKVGAKVAHTATLMPSGGAERRTAGGELALITVSFNSASVLGALLDSVGRHLPGVRVIVVDCGSSDDSAAIARTHPVAVAVDAGANLGFGRGSNLGLTHVAEPVTVFVNPDVELIDGSLRALASELMTASGARRLLAPLVLSEDGSRQDTAHPPPGSAAELARLLLPPAHAPGVLGSALAPWRADRPRRVGWAVGCALAGRTETLRALGPFSEQIFLYGEDLELGLRAAREGVDTWFWPRARVVHHRAHATAAAYGGEPFALLAAARSRAIAMALGARAARRDERAQAALFGSRALVKRALDRDCSRELAQLRAVRSLLGSIPAGGDGGSARR